MSDELSNRWTISGGLPFEIEAEPTNRFQPQINHAQFQELYLLQNPHLIEKGVIITDKNTPLYIKLQEKRPATFDIYPSYSTPTGILEVPEEDFERYIGKEGRPIIALVLTNRKYMKLLGIPDSYEEPNIRVPF